MEKQQILTELNELLNIPQFERIIFHKLEELKLYFKEEIERYRDLKENFKKNAYGDMQILEVQNDRGKKIQTYHFELSKTKDGQWIGSAIEPSPPSGYEIYDIIPERIVEYIGSFTTSPGKIEILKEFSLEKLKGRAFDLSFTKYSDWHVLGTIKSYQIPTGDNSGDEKWNHTTDIYNYNKKDTDKGDYNELLYYMKKYPPLKRYFFTELHMKVKPLIMGDLIEITASSQPVDLF